MFIDHYRVLGIPVDSELQEIKKAFRELARIHHPDRGGKALQFHRIYTAYRLLSNSIERKEYDRQYLKYLNLRKLGNDRTRYVIRENRFRFPASAAALAKKGLLRRKFSSKDRRKYLNIDCDLELILKESELNMPLLLQVPVVVRQICPDCAGSDPHCFACYGKGSYKASRSVDLNIDGGLVSGQIIEIDLASRRPPGRLCHFKKRSLRIKIICLSKKSIPS